VTQAFSLTGRRALVTGSSQGIGLALAGALLDAGAEVVLNGRDARRLGAAAATLRERGAVRLLPFDVTDHGAAREAVDGFEAATGPIDILVNNAGVQHRAPLEDFAEADFERLFRANVFSVSTWAKPAPAT
jgi:gluconate 5-dehydrogenase